MPKKLISNDKSVTRQELQHDLEEIRAELSRFEERILEKLDKRDAEMKDYMYNLVDSVLSEIKDMRVEHTAQTENIPAMREELINHDDRLISLEKVVFV